MIYSLPDPATPLDQADLIDGVPLLEIRSFDPQTPDNPAVGCSLHRVLVLTQTCDLSQRKSNLNTVAKVLDADELVSRGILKAADVRGPIRGIRVWGLYFLPKSDHLQLPELIVDFRQLHSVPLNLLESLCAAGKRVAHLDSLYREHLAKHFADTYSRIGLPMPYETE